MKSRISRRYFAGLLDGEGYISIQPAKIREGKYFSPVVKMALVDKSAYILFEIKELFGGYIYKRKYENQNYNDSFYWEIHSFDGVEKILRYVYPYLILKKEQAKLVLTLIKTKRKETKIYTKMPVQIFNKRQSLYCLVKKLNERGRSPASTNRETPTVKNEGEVIVRTESKDSEINGTETLIQQN